MSFTFAVLVWICPDWRISLRLCVQVSAQFSKPFLHWFGGYTTSIIPGLDWDLYILITVQFLNESDYAGLNLNCMDKGRSYS
jgi:hypothetical protein